MMMGRMFLQVVTVGCCLLVGWQAKADNTITYLSVMPDVPIMQGLSEDVSESVIFDKEQGKVAESVLLGQNTTHEAVNSYYQETLGQLGWKAQKTGVFLRNDEQLIVKIEKVGAGVRVVLSLSPKMP